MFNFIALFSLTAAAPLTPETVTKAVKEMAWDDLLAEIGSVSAERVGQGEAGGCTRRVQTAWPRLGSALNSPWLEPGRPFLGF